MNYTTHPIYYRDPFSGMHWSIPSEWIIKDLQHVVVCTCSKEYNAKIICRLLNKYL